MPQVRLRTVDFDRRRRVAEFQAAAAHVCKLDIVPCSDAEYRSETHIGILPDLVIADTTHSACTTTRSSRLAAETGDNVLIHIPRSGGFTIRQSGGEEVDCGPGAIYLDPNEVSGVAAFRGTLANVLYVSIPRALLKAATPGLNRTLRRSTAATPEWRLFRDYALGLHRELPHLSHRSLVRGVQHVQDLVLMALDVGGDDRQIAIGRGVRHARLRAIKADIEANLASEALSLGWLAGRHGISERTIRSLFHDAGTTFVDFVTGRRLEHVHRRLLDPLHASETISQIALAAGFGDLSWFNTRFKRAYGATPRDIRHGGSMPRRT